MQNIKSPGADISPHSEQGAVPMPEHAVIQHIKHCRDLTRDFAAHVLPVFWKHWSKAILEHAEQAKSNKDQVALFEVQNLIVAVQAPAEQEFCQNLANGFAKFRNKTLSTSTGEERFTGDMLSLVEHSDLEETIAITSIANRAENVNSTALWALQQRLALLNNGEKIDEKGNPVSPVQFCEALRNVLASLEVDVKTKIIGYKFFDQDVIGELEALYEKLNAYLIQQNLLPNLRYTATGEAAQRGAAKGTLFSNAQPATEDGSSRRANDPAPAIPGMPDFNDPNYQLSLLSAIKLLQAHITQQGIVSSDAPPPQQAIPAANYSHPADGISHFSQPNPLPQQPLTVYNNQQLVGVFDHMQNQTLAMTQRAFEQAAPGQIVQLVPQQSAEISQQMMQQIATENESGAVGAADMRTIDLVGLLFEFMLSDEHLPDSVKALLSYLHTPFLKIAFLDKDFFEQQEHPARLLLNSMADAGTRWVDNDGGDQHEIFNKIKITVFRLLEDFKNDVRLIAEILLEFNAYTNNIARRQELMEKRALEKARGEEKLRDAKQQVNDLVRSKTDNRDMPSAILLLLLQPWSDYLSFLLLRYGDQSDSWLRAVRVIDDLLWAIEPKMSDADKVQLIEKQDSLVAAIEYGFETIGYEQAKSRKLIDAIVGLQGLALQSRKAEPAPEPMRTKLESLAAEKVGPVTGLQDEPQTKDETKIVESLKMIEFGTWFEFEGGKRLKVAWFNQKTNHYMMVDQQGKKVSLIAGLQLAREMIAGKAKVIAGSTKPFFERALENIYQVLSEPVTWWQVQIMSDLSDKHYDRAHYRHVVSGPIDVFDGIRTIYLGRLVNIHEHGLMIVGDFLLEEDKLYEIDLYIPEGDSKKQVLRIGVDCLWTREADQNSKHWAGFTIIDTSPQAAEEIRKLIDAWGEN